MLLNIIQHEKFGDLIIAPTEIMESHSFQAFVNIFHIMSSETCPYFWNSVLISVVVWILYTKNNRFWKYVLN